MLKNKLNKSIYVFVMYYLHPDIYKIVTLPFGITAFLFQTQLLQSPVVIIIRIIRDFKYF